MKLDAVEDVLVDVRDGKPVVIIDAKDRENEGDLMVAGESVTVGSMNFMLEHGKGLVCLALTKERLADLRVPLQVSENTAPLGTNFTVSIDHRSVVGHGVTASARVKTIRAASIDGEASDFVMPGFVFPLSAAVGGTLRRSGQTEGSVDLARLSGLKPAGVICEIMGADGAMLRGASLAKYCKQFDLKITSVVEIARYRLRHELSIRRVAEGVLSDLIPSGLLDTSLHAKAQGVPTKVYVYVDDADDKEHLAIVLGDPGDGALVRLHSECLTGDIFASLRCDCGGQLSSALNSIIEEGSGVVVYLSQEGRGIGLGNKLRAYALQDKGRDTVDANLELGFEPDLRDYRVGAQILRDLGVKSIRLLTNNPQKISSLREFGLDVIERVSVPPVVSAFNTTYLQTKREKLGHLL